MGAGDEYKKKAFEELGQGHFKISSVSLVKGRTYRFEFTPTYQEQVDYIEIGDKIVYGLAINYMDAEKKAKKTVGNSAAAVQLNQCGDFLLEDITLYASLTMGFRLYYSVGDITLRRTNIKLRPGTDRLLATPSDGVHTDYNRGAVIIEDCYMESTGDDILSPHTKEETVVGVYQNRTVELLTTSIAYYYPVTKPNDEYLFLDRGSGAVLGNAIVQSVTMNPSTRQTLVTLDRDVEGLFPGATCINMSAVGSGTMIRNNTLNPVLRNAILLRAVNCTVENNTINCNGGENGITALDATSTGPIAKNIVIKNNKIYDAEEFGMSIGSRFTQLRDSDAGGNITLTGNYVSSRGINAIRVLNTNGITMKDNVVVMDKIAEGNAVDVVNTKDLTIDGLRVEDNRDSVPEDTVIKFDKNCPKDTITIKSLDFDTPDGMSEYVFE